MKKNRHKGFSMVELIIVVAIMGICTSLATIGFGYLQSGNVKSAARNIDATLTKLRLDTMKQTNQPIMYIYMKGSDYYMYCSANGFNRDSAAGQRIGNSNVSITAKKGADSSPEETLGPSNTFQITFDKGKGTFTSDYTHIYVRPADGKGVAYDLKMITETGKHFVNVMK